MEDLPANSIETVLAQPAPPPAPRPHLGHRGGFSIDRGRGWAEMPPPSSATPSEELPETRSSRSASSASRNSNRLSLTLPIAPPTSYPTRPTPTLSTTSSHPPTPIESALTSPTDPNDFVIAIAAQERRVLELREELSQAESELSRLKKHWSFHEAHKKREQARNAEPLRPLVPQQPDGPVSSEDAITRRSVEIDRRKALLLSQQSQQSTPTQHRRRVIRGGHTRTLSLLSPARTGDSFSVHEDQPEEPKAPTPSSLLDSQQNMSRFAPFTPAQLSKRASWAPRSVHQTAANGVTNGVKQIAEDFKAGLWTFVEDLRQATVGDEPITGVGATSRAMGGSSRPGAYVYDGEEQETIKAAGASSRPRVAAAFDETPSPASRFVDLQLENRESWHKRTESKSRSRPEGRDNKRFSWTPLTVDYENDDWSNWDSPTVKSPRWSGTTVNGDIIPTIPEKGDENESPLKKKSSLEDAATATTTPHSRSPSPSNKLEELLPPVLNRLTPSNIQRTASDLMKQWEKSLSPPPSTPGPVAAVGVEKGV